MDYEEYEDRRARIEREYLKDLADLHADWMREHPEDIVEALTSQAYHHPENTWDRARRAIEALDGEFTLEDVRKAHEQLYPGVHVPANSATARLLGHMVFDGEVEEIRYREPGRHPAIYRKAGHDAERGGVGV